MPAATIMTIPVRELAITRGGSVYQATVLETEQKTEQVSTKDLQRILADGSAIVLDSRKRSEYVAGHIAGACNVAPAPGAPPAEYAAAVERLLGGDKGKAGLTECGAAGEWRARDDLDRGDHRLSPLELAEKSLQFVRRPRNHLIDRLAGHQLCQHRRLRAAAVDLHGDIRRGWCAGDMRPRMVRWADRVVIHRANWWLDLVPHGEVEHAVERRNVEA